MHISPSWSIRQGGRGKVPGPAYTPAEKDASPEGCLRGREKNCLTDYSSRDEPASPPYPASLVATRSPTSVVE